MAGTYSPPEPTSVDFTVREAQPPQPTGLDIVVNGNEILASYSAPDNDSVNLSLQEETVADNDSADFFIEASTLELYGPPKQNNLDFTLARTFVTTQDDTDYVVGAEFNASLMPYRAPDQNNLDFTLARTLKPEQNDADFTVGGEFKPQLIPYEPPTQNSLDFVIDKYQADTQDSADFTIAGEFTPEKYEFQAPPYTPEQPDNLTFTLFGYESQQPDELLFELSTSANPSDGPYTISQTNTSISAFSPDQDSNVAAETATTPTQLSTTQQSNTQQPVSNISNSLDPTQTETVVSNVTNTVTSERYVQLLIQSTAGISLDQLSAEQKDKEKVDVGDNVSVLSPEQSSNRAVEINTSENVLLNPEQDSNTIAGVNNAAQALATQFDTDRDLIAVTQLQTITTLESGPEDQHTKGELFAGDPTSGLRKLPTEYPVGEGKSVTESFTPQESSVTQTEVLVSTTSPEVQVSATAIAPVSDVIQNLEIDQDTIEILTVDNTIEEGLAPLGRKRVPQSEVFFTLPVLEPDRDTVTRVNTSIDLSVLSYEWERGEFPQGTATATTSSFGGEQGTHSVIDIDLDPRAIKYVLSQHTVAKADATAGVVETQTPELPYSPSFLTTTSPEIQNSSNPQAPGFATTDSPDIENSSNVQAVVGNETNSEIYQIPEYEEQVVGISTTAETSQQSQNVQARAVATSDSFSVEEVNYLTQLAGITVDEYLHEAQSYVSADGSVQVFVGDETVENEYGIVVINVPIITNLEYFEREDIGSGGGQPIPFRSAAVFSSDFGVFKRGEKSVFLL